MYCYFKMYCKFQAKVSEVRFFTRNKQTEKNMWLRVAALEATIVPVVVDKVMMSSLSRVLVTATPATQ